MFNPREIAPCSTKFRMDTGDNEEDIMKLKEGLNDAFIMKDTGEMRYILRIEVAKNHKGLNSSWISLNPVANPLSSLFLLE